MSASLPINDQDPFSFTLSGSERDRGYVRLSELSDCISRIEGCFRQTERCVQGSSPKLVYLVRRMKVGSPAFCEFEAEKPVRGGDCRKEVFGLVLSTIAALEQGRLDIDPRLDFEALTSYRKVGQIAMSDNPQARCGLILGKTVVSPQFQQTLSQLLTGQECAYGSVTGTLEKVDIHQKLQFAIFPHRSASQVVCTFQDELLDRVLCAVRERKPVTVYGKLHYSANRKVPIRVDVVDLEQESGPEEMPLPRLTDLVGKMASSDFDDSVTTVRKLRDDWDR